MSRDQMMLLMYGIFWLARINPFLRRWKLPLLRGPEWFLSVNVQPGFYDGPGREILRRYRMRILLPFAIDVVATALILSFGKVSYLFWVVFFLTGFIHANQLFSVALAERRARAYAIQGTEQPAAAMVLSLTPRKLADYTNRRLEIVFALLTLGTVAWLIYFYRAAPGQHSLRDVFGIPLILLYSHLGALFVKWGLVAWRTPLPLASTQEHMELRERARRFHLLACDLLRASFTMQLVLWPFSFMFSRATASRFVSGYVLVTVGISFIMTLWQERRRKEMLEFVKRVRPIFMKDSLDDGANPNFMLCYRPEAPLTLIKGVRGYALNLANSRTQVGAAYIAGFVTLVVLLMHWH